MATTRWASLRWNGEPPCRLGARLLPGVLGGVLSVCTCLFPLLCVPLARLFESFAELVLQGDGLNSLQTLDTMTDPKRRLWHDALSWNQIVLSQVFAAAHTVCCCHDLAPKVVLTKCLVTHTLFSSFLSALHAGSFGV